MAVTKERALRVADLQVGDWGVLRVRVSRVAPVRTFQRKNGGEGVMGRVTLADDSGEVDIVLWGEETRQQFTPGESLVLRGATVKAGYRGGVELGLHGAVVERPAAGNQSLTGTLQALGETTPVDGRFQADAVLATTLGDVHLILWDDAVLAAQAQVGNRVTLEGVAPHPALEGWYLADGAKLTPQPS